MFVCCREQYSGEMEGDSEEEGRETGCHARVRRGMGHIAHCTGERLGRWGPCRYPSLWGGRKLRDGPLMASVFHTGNMRQGHL